MSTQVTEPGRGEQGVADRVGRDIAVRMAGQPGLARPEQAREIQRPAITKWVDVRSHTDLRKYAWHDDQGTREPLAEPRLSRRDCTCT